MRAIYGILVLGLLAGCSGSLFDRTQKSRASYDAAVADYRSCLDANPTSPQNCEGKKASMQAQEQLYRNLSGDLDRTLNRPNATIVVRQQ